MWNCTFCSEANEDSFDSCWNCGTGKDGTPPPEDFAERMPTHNEEANPNGEATNSIADAEVAKEDPSSGKTNYLETGSNIIFVAAFILYFGTKFFGAQAGAQLGALAGGASAGGLCGLLPFFVLHNKKSSGFAIGAICICTVAGLAGGLYLALPVAIVLAGVGYLVVPNKKIHPAGRPDEISRRCSHCGFPYRLEEYDSTAKHIYCSQCKNELLATSGSKPTGQG